MNNNINDNTKHITYITNHEKNSFRRIIINRNYKTKRYYIDFFVAGYKYNDGKTYIVLSGLAEGDMIIAEGAGLMREGTAVNTESSTEPIK